ncbi:hypothetical protein BCU12_05895 [Vibrio sp. 10N.261.55.A7]|nr:hypothetical protein BCU12_05895 [Vibrio sp. 10N.261.55.A7]
MANPIIHEKYQLSRRVGNCRSNEEVLEQIFMYKNNDVKSRMAGYRLYKFNVELKRLWRSSIALFTKRSQ